MHWSGLAWQCHGRSIFSQRNMESPLDDVADDPAKHPMQTRRMRQGRPAQTSIRRTRWLSTDEAAIDEASDADEADAAGADEAATMDADKATDADEEAADVAAVADVHKAADADQARCDGRGGCRLGRLQRPHNHGRQLCGRVWQRTLTTTRGPSFGCSSGEGKDYCTVQYVRASPPRRLNRVCA